MRDPIAPSVLPGQYVLDLQERVLALGTIPAVDARVEIYNLLVARRTSVPPEVLIALDSTIGSSNVSTNAYQRTKRFRYFGVLMLIDLKKASRSTGGISGFGQAIYLSILEEFDQLLYDSDWEHGNEIPEWMVERYITDPVIFLDRYRHIMFSWAVVLVEKLAREGSK